MKSGSYEDLVSRFYAGTASPEEISLLKEAGLITPEDELYALALQAEREQKMDWSFDAFMEEAKPAKVVILPPASHWVKKLAAAAAVAAVLICTYLFWPQENPAGEMVAGPAKTKAIITDRLNDADTAATMAAVVTVRVKKQNIVRKRITSRNEDEVSRKEKATPAAVIDSLPIAESWLVIVNGKPVNDEKEAVAIAGKSMAIFSRSLTQTMEALKPIAQIKIKL